MLGTYVVTRYDDVVSVLNDPATFSSSVSIPSYRSNPPEVREALGPDFQGVAGVKLVVADPPEHADHKRIGSWLFRRDRVNAFVPRIREIGAELISGFVDAGEVELISQFSEPFAYQVLCDFIGIPKDARDDVRTWTDQIITLVDPTASIENKLAAARAVHDWKAFADELVAMRTSHPENDMVTEMIAAGHADRAREYVEGALTAGIYTTRDMISSCVVALMHPDNRKYWDELGVNPEIAPSVIEESMRQDAPHKGLSRIATRDARIGDTDVPAGSLVMPLVGSANRDESVFLGPDVFDPHRDNVKQHLAFGRGIHLCIGAYLARADGAIVLELLARALPNAKLADGFVPEYFPSMFFRGLQDVRLSW
ncbi:cytochrome P450 [Actinopolymorpha pittospori]